MLSLGDRVWIESPPQAREKVVNALRSLKARLSAEPSPPAQTPASTPAPKQTRPPKPDAHDDKRERLRRLLLVVPAARRKPGAHLDELAKELGLDPAQLRADIDLLGGQLQHVAGRLRHEHVGLVGLEELPKRGDEAVEGHGCGRRWALSPEGVDQAVGRNDPIRVQGEEGEHGPLLSAPEPERAAFDTQLDRAEELDLDVRDCRLSRIHSSPT